MASIFDVPIELDVFSKNFRHPSLPALNFVPDLYDLLPHLPTNHTAKGQWPAPWLSSFFSPGVYFVFDDSLNLLYVGVSTVAISIRTYDHFRTDRSTGLCSPKDTWPSQPRFIAALPVNPSMAWDACGLECYLIQQLKPPKNIQRV